MDTAEVWNTEDHPAWLGLSARLGPLVNRAAGRADLVTTITPDSTALAAGHKTGRPAAMFVPALAQVRFTAQTLLDAWKDHPGHIDPADRLSRNTHPVLIGAACHEAAHAAHTHITFPKGIPMDEATWAMLLEEPRIEGAHLRANPRDRTFLRASAQKIAAGGQFEFRAPEGVSPSQSAMRCAVLVLGRVAAGVFTGLETYTLREQVSAVLGDDVLTEVEDVLAQAVALADGDVDALRVLARQIVAILADQDQQDDGDSGDQQGQGGDQQGQGGDQQGQGDSGGEGMPGTDADGTSNGNAQQMPCGSWTNGDLDDGLDPFDQTPATGNAPGDDTVTEAEATVTEIGASAEKDASDTADQVRAARTDQGTHNAAAEAKAADETHRRHTDGAWKAACGTQPRQVRITHREPSPELREQTRVLTRVLRSEQIRAVTRTTTPSITPPGRMRMGEEVHRRAQIAARARITATPYRQTHRRDIPNPPLLVGFAGDASGTMEPWQDVTADLAWALGQAAKSLNGSVANVAWNTVSTTVLRPGQVPAQVPVATCGGGSTGCVSALDALDGALHLTGTPDAARVVVIVTDGGIGLSRPDVIAAITRLARAGVAVLWVTPEPDPITTHATNVVLTDPAQFGAVIAKSIAKVLRDA